MLTEQIDEAAACRGDAPYLEDEAGDATLTYAGLRRCVRAWARHLDEAGIPAGARVAIRLPDPFGYAGALVGIVAAGRVAVPLDPGAPAADVARMLKVAQPWALVGDDLESGLPVLGLPEPELPGPELPGPGLPGPGLPGPGLPGPGLPGPGPAGAGRGGIFLCTSGTTGTPKGILLREDQLMHVARSVAAHHRLTPADRGYCCLPLFHINAEVVGLLATLAAGACLVVDRKFSRRGFWELIGTRQITWINAVPAIITILAMDPPVAVPGRVRFIRSASAPLAPSALERFEDSFGIPVVETYGMTEAASMITANPLDGPRKAGSAGRPAGTEVRVVSRDGDLLRPCPPGTIGRVQIRGPGVITEYAAGGPAGAIDADGWLETGDLGHLDQDGYLFLAGRSDDVINRGGEKIYPREIEEFLLTQPGVRSAVVVAASDEVLGQRPVAYVVPAVPAADAGGPDLVDALRAACAAALPRPKRPTEFCLVPELPLGATGKVSRRRLRELAMATG
ncbi:MAG: AMP-binding protein [Streptosporangiaceae bacterium]